MPEQNKDNFVAQLTGCQRRMYGFILSLVGDVTQADDILQEANVVLWRKAGEFKPGTSFDAWAFQVAYNQVRTYRKSLPRERMVFDDELLAVMADEFADERLQADERQEADDYLRMLEQCIGKLPQHLRDMLTLRYMEDTSVQDLATQFNRPANTIAQILHRIRLELQKCIEMAMSRRDA